MATCSSNDFCDICKKRHKSSLAVKWCPECEEKLCEDCSSNHSVSKLSCGHVVIEIEHFRKIPSFILKMKNLCDQHELKYTNLCLQHDRVCCPACTSGSGPHSKCSTLLLQEVINSGSTPTLLKSIEDSFKILKTNLEMIINDRKTNLQQLHDQRKDIEKEIKQFKKKIINRLNVIEKKVMKEMNSKVNVNSKKLESEVKSLELKLRKAEKLLETTNTIAHYGSELQTYIRAKTMETELAKENNLLQDLVNNGTLKRLGVKFVTNKKDAGVLENISTFGFISVEIMPFSVVLASEGGNRAQIMSQRTGTAITDIKVTLKSKLQFTNHKLEITGCSVFPSGKMIFSNYALCNVTLLKENGEKEKEIQTLSKPFDVTVIDYNTVSVSTEDGIELINIATGTAEKTIPTGMCYGVDYYNGSLICWVSGKGILSVDLSSSTTTTLVSDTRITGCFCTIHRNKIYVARAVYDTVTCYSMKGDELWKFNDYSVIACPVGIAVDNSSNVFVASYNNNTVVGLSPDGKRSRTLLTKEDGMEKPCALHINRSKNQLIIVNHGPVFLFDL